jgi:hypothetical protein
LGGGGVLSLSPLVTPFKPSIALSVTAEFQIRKSDDPPIQKLS